MNTGKSYTGPIIMFGALFVIFGFVTWMNGLLIPFLKIACQLSYTQSTLVAFAFYISYFVMALPSSWILEKTGFKNGMTIGLFIMAIGALLFIPAANLRVYELFLTGLFVTGTGLCILQTAVNPYLTIVGPIESAAKRISIMGICNKVAGAAAPFMMGKVILDDADTIKSELKILDEAHQLLKLDELASRIIIPYVIMAVVFIVFGIIVRRSKLPEIDVDSGKAEAISVNDNQSTILQFPNLVLGVIALFLYVGVEVLAADMIGPFGESLGIPLSEAKSYTSRTLIAMIIGYVIGVLFIPKYISQSKALAVSAIIGVILSILAIITSGYTAVFFIASLGIANALMWPAIWPLAIDGLGRFTKLGSALLIMAIAGGATLPVIYGKLADKSFIGPQQAFWIMVPCYLFILFYSLKGHKIKRWIDQRKTT